MTKKIYISFLVYTLLGCINVERNDVATVEIRDTIREYYSAGTIKYLGPMLSAQKSGKHIWYYANGEIQATSSYTDGKEDGERISYFNNRNLVSSIAILKDGFYVDSAIFYSIDGSIESILHFDQNGIDSLSYRFYQTGELMYVRTFVKPYYLDKLSINTQKVFELDGNLIKEKSNYWEITNNEIMVHGFDVGALRLVYGDLDTDFSLLDYADTIQSKTNIFIVPNNIIKKYDPLRFIVEETVIIEDSINGEGLMYKRMFGEIKH